MTRREMNLKEMLSTLEEFLVSNLSSFEAKAAILAVIDKLKAQNAEIKRLSQSQAESTEADYAIKGSTEDVLMKTAVRVSDGLMAIAATTNDVRLKIDGKVSKWELGRMREDDLYVRLKQLHIAALAHVDQLLPMGITTGEVKMLDVESDVMMKMRPSINVTKAKTTKATADLGQTITDINNVVRETLDALMLEFKLLNPTLYGEYLNARKINNRSAGRASKQEPPQA